MRIIPVIDLKDGQVVHAVAGDRQHYRPIQSVLAAGSEPAAVARAFREQLRVGEVYVADLDAIAGAEPAVSQYQAISDTGLLVWLDAGVQSMDDFQRVSGPDAPFVPHRLILALESLSLHDLRYIARQATRENLVFSLDLRHGKPITTQADWRGKTPLEILRHVVEMGIESAIVLDLADVGTGCGLSSLELYRQIRRRFPQLCLIPGGGIRGNVDLATLSEIGCWATLVASAIHRGDITASDIEALKA